MPPRQQTPEPQRSRWSALPRRKTGAARCTRPPFLIPHGSADAGGANPISQARSSRRTRRSGQDWRSLKASPVSKGSDPFLERDRDAAVRAQANLVPFDLGDEAAWDIMTVTGMAP